MLLKIETSPTTRRNEHLITAKMKFSDLKALIACMRGGKIFAWIYKAYPPTNYHDSFTAFNTSN